MTPDHQHTIEETLQFAYARATELNTLLNIPFGKNPACYTRELMWESSLGRDRRYCNDTCRVQHHRKQQREKQHTVTLPFSRVPVLPVSHDPLVSRYQCV